MQESSDLPNQYTAELMGKRAEGEQLAPNEPLDGDRKRSKGMAGTTGLEPATSDVTGLGSGLAQSTIYLCFQQLEGVMLGQGPS